MDIYRLLSDELVYELYIQNLPSRGTVPENRARLASALRLEASSVTAGAPTCIDLPPIREFKVCNQKLVALSNDIWNLDTLNSSNEYKKIFNSCKT